LTIQGHNDLKGNALYFISAKGTQSMLYGQKCSSIQLLCLMDDAVWWKEDMQGENLGLGFINK
jgi:hypothetical protein